jgi:hypothetical protein
MNQPIRNIKKSKKTKKVNKIVIHPNVGHTSLSEKPLSNSIIKTKDLLKKATSRIIKLDSVVDNSHMRIQLEYSLDNRLVDKLFICKGQVSVEKRIFI